MTIGIKYVDEFKAQAVKDNWMTNDNYTRKYGPYPAEPPEYGLLPWVADARQLDAPDYDACMDISNYRFVREQLQERWPDHFIEYISAGEANLLVRVAGPDEMWMELADWRHSEQHDYPVLDSDLFDQLETDALNRQIDDFAMRDLVDYIERKAEYTEPDSNPFEALVVREDGKWATLNEKFRDGLRRMLHEEHAYAGCFYSDEGHDKFLLELIAEIPAMEREERIAQGQLLLPLEVEVTGYRKYL